MTHLVADEASATTPTGPWLKLSAALTECVAHIAERQDLLVQCAPGTGRGSPGCFVPALASVELETTGDEIVDVQTTAAASAEMASCITEAIWPARYSGVGDLRHRVDVDGTAAKDESEPLVFGSPCAQ